MTPRALEVLKEAHAVLAEDTRTTGKLLRHFGVDTPLRAFHQHNEHRALTGVVQQLEGGVTLALCSDAGTPGISDPGFLLVRAWWRPASTSSACPAPPPLCRRW